jgi:hypothetical protein
MIFFFWLGSLQKLSPSNADGIGPLLRCEARSGREYKGTNDKILNNHIFEVSKMFGFHLGLLKK